jgi:GTP cyclohydrolase II
MADPADDLTHPMKGPFASQREGGADLHRAALRLAKSAHLLPAAVVVPLAEADLAAAHGLTLLTRRKPTPPKPALTR